MIDLVDGPSLRSGFMRHVACSPERTALVVGSARMTYAELDEAARKWAGAIVDRVKGRAERIGVFAYRSEVGYVGTLASLYAGAAFVPLNRTFPVERTIAMAQHARMDAIIVDRGSLPQLARVLASLEPTPVVVAPEVFGLDRISCGAPVVTRLEIEQTQPLRDLPPVLLDDIAYLLFTSGSTGKPKGVGVTHANIVHFLEVMQRRLGVTPEDRFSQTFAQTFDVSVFDIFMAWQQGASVYAMRPIDVLAPTKYVTQHELTVWFSVPSVVALMRRRGLLRSNSMPSLRYSLFAGEPLPRKSAECWLDAAPNSIVENLYGPTELTIVCFGHRWDPATSPSKCHNELVPMGRPFEGLCTLIRNGDDSSPGASSVEGELYVAGPQTVPGYWCDENNTKERFINIPLSSTGNKRFYRTGDRVLRREDGEYLYLGRVDHQVKVLGFRVELSEIEGALCKDPNVIDAAALGWPIEEGRALGVVAFVTGNGVDPHDLKQTVAQWLPSYMVPSSIYVLEQMPLNPNGKIDRSCLVGRLESLSRTVST